MENKKTVYVIAGPTASGKSAVAYYLAKRINGEIVNCDSIQLYKYMNIGSAKPSDEMMEEVKHHLFSIVEPDYNMTVATYSQLAMAVINDILERGKTPIVVGGTGLYINSILYKMDFAAKPRDDSRRIELEKMAEENGAEYMHHFLAGMDPEAAERIHPNNVRKVIRAIESFESGVGIGSLDDCQLKDEYDFRFFGLTMDREWLYDRINKRVDKLISQGLVDEVLDLIEMGYTSDLPAMKGIGYKEIFEYIDGITTLEEAIDSIKKNTRHYAKRQLTWFKRYSNIKWIEIRKNVSIGNVIDQMLKEDHDGEIDDRQ